MIGYNLVFISQNQNPDHLCGAVGATLFLFINQKILLLLYLFHLFSIKVEMKKKRLRKNGQP